MILEEKYTLSNGVKIPKLGLGTWFISDKDMLPAVKEVQSKKFIREMLFGLNLKKNTGTALLKIKQ